MITLGIDSGTQSTKTIALDLESGEILASSQKSYGMIEGLPAGHLEQDPLAWIDAVDATVRGCLEKLGARKGEVVAIGVSGQQHGLVALDKENNPVRPAKLWCDTSTVGQCEQFAREFGGAKGLIELAGNTVLPGYTAPKILWLKQNEPANFAATRSFLLPHDYINWWLSGEKRMEYGDASGTALMDVRSRTWSQPLCDFIEPGFAGRLPALGSSAEPVGLLREELRTAWGLGQNVIISAGGGDNMMGAIGTGNIEAGVVTVSLGTSGTLYSFAESPVIDPNGEIAAFCDSTDHWMPLVCTMNVTVASETVRRMFNWEVKAFDEAVAGAPAGSNGVLFLPYLNGERTPNLPEGCGVFHGLTMTNMQPANLARAAVEGATLGLAYGLKRFRQLGIKPTGIRLTGGGSRSAIWRQIAADIFGVPTVCLTSSEGAALGSAIQAAWCREKANGGLISLGDLTSRLVTVDASTEAQPNSAHADLYNELLNKLTGLTTKLHSAGYL